MNHFFAYMSRMKYIKRWGLMKNIQEENIQEHSLSCAMVAHALALIENKYYGGKLNPEFIMAMAVYHETGEVITGDLATPIKYFNDKINAAYKEVESIAEDKMLSYLPADLREDYRVIIKHEDNPDYIYVKAADRICAYVKCLEELKSGNREFEKAKYTIEQSIHDMNLPSVEYFMREFVPSFNLTLDELN